MSALPPAPETPSSRSDEVAAGWYGERTPPQRAPAIVNERRERYVQYKSFLSVEVGDGRLELCCSGSPATTTPAGARRSRTASRFRWEMRHENE